MIAIIFRRPGSRILAAIAAAVLCLGIPATAGAQSDSLVISQDGSVSINAPLTVTGTVTSASRVQDKTGAITPVGALLAFAGPTAPAGWLVCDGREVSRTVYADLFAVIGTNFGAGDGVSTFNLPDMREAAPVGVGTSSRTEAAHDAYGLGEFKDDRFQGHKLDGTVSAAYYAYGGAGQAAALIFTGASSQIASLLGNQVLVADSTNGPPRIGPVTRGKRMGVNFIIKF